MGFLGKFVLIVALFVGGGSIAWADDIVIVNGNAIADGWSNGGADAKSCTQSSSKGVAFLTTTNGQLTAQGNYSWHSINSSNTITISSAQTIVLKLKGNTSSAKYEFSYSTDNSTFQNVQQTIGSTSDFVEYEIKNITGNYYLYLWTYAINIQSIQIKNPSGSTTPTLNVTHPQDGDAFGYVTTNTTKTYSVTNEGVGSMNVTISSNNDAFILSTNSLTDITNDGTGKTFDVTFNYDSNVLEPQKAIITVTPTFEGGVAHSFEISAGPDAEFNEDKATTWTTGSGKNVYVKYTANNGWNTICLPIAPNGYKTQLFGSGATVKAYALNSYDNNGTLTFENASYMGARTPYLVYVENAASRPFVVENVYVGYTTGGNVSKGNTTFQGTFAPMSMEGKYGVTSSGQVMQGTATADIKGYRAYFTGITPPAGGARPTIVFEDDEDTQGLSAVMWMENTKDAYNLQGQKVEKGRKGIYIVNGRKVVIK